VTKKTLKPYDWIQKIPGSLAELDAIPLMGHPPIFPWENLTKELSQTFEVQELKIEPSEFEWREQGELFSGLGGPLVPLNVSFSAFKDLLYFVLSEEDIQDLMQTILIKDQKTIAILEKEQQDAFYTFLGLQIIQAINTLKYEPAIIPQLVKKAQLPAAPMLSLDIIFSLNGQRKVARLFFPPKLRKSIAKHYGAANSAFSAPLAEKIEATLHIEAGSTALSQEEWSKINPGDFLILDHCTLKPGSEEGKVIITFGGQPFLNGEINEGKVKIVDHPQYYREAK